jgi:hypothetical protein
MIRDAGYRLSRALAAAAIALIAWTAQRAEAQELVYGSWPPAGQARSGEIVTPALSPHYWRLWQGRRCAKRGRRI